MKYNSKQKLTSKIDDLGKAATKEEIIELINKATTGKIDDAADAANKTSGGWLDAGENTLVWQQVFFLHL